MDHTSSTPKSRGGASAPIKRARKIKNPERTSFPADMAVDDAETKEEAPVVAPENTEAATVFIDRLGGTVADLRATPAGDTGNQQRTALNRCTIVDECIGPPIGQQVCTLTVHVQPSRFPEQYFAAGDHAIRGKSNLNDCYYRCPPHTPVFTDSSIKSSDGVPRVMSHAIDTLEPGNTFRFVGITMEDGCMDVGAQKQHRASAGKGRFTVAMKGAVTVNISEENIRAGQFAFGDPFCLSMYNGDGETISGAASKLNSFRTCEFGGRLSDTGQRTFV